MMIRARITIIWLMQKMKLVQTTMEKSIGIPVDFLIHIYLSQVKSAVLVVVAILIVKLIKILTQDLTKTKQLA